MSEKIRKHNLDRVFIEKIPKEEKSEEMTLGPGDYDPIFKKNINTYRSSFISKDIRNKNY